MLHGERLNQCWRNLVSFCQINMANQVCFIVNTWNLRSLSYHQSGTTWDKKQTRQACLDLTGALGWSSSFAGHSWTCHVTRTLPFSQFMLDILQSLLHSVLCVFWNLQTIVFSHVQSWLNLVSFCQSDCAKIKPGHEKDLNPARPITF